MFIFYLASFSNLNADSCYTFIHTSAVVGHMLDGTLQLDTLKSILFAFSFTSF